MAENKSIQLFVKLLDNKTLTLQFSTHQTLTAKSIKQQIETLTQIPTQLQKLTLNGKFLENPNPIPTQSLSLSTLYLTFSLLGGKGGFGSLLRGAATKAGQKKTNNFDACRDMSGRRLRHVNAEKKLEEWKAEEEERRLEKVAEEYLKKMAKKGKGGKKDDVAEKYVEKYREDSARCKEEVERSVREMLGGGKKRKLMDKLKGDSLVDAKKLKIWMGKRKLVESDSDDSDDDDKSDNSDGENEKSDVIDNGNHSDSSKDASSGSISVPQSKVDHCVEASSDSGFVEEKETVTCASVGPSGDPSGNNGHVNRSGPVEMSSDIEEISMGVEQATNEPNLSGTIVDDHGSSECKLATPERVTESSTVLSQVSGPLNFDDFSSAAELKVIGMERLKSELQARGLKCGGTLQERASRLFLLKTTPLDKLPKKLLAKK